LVTALRLAIRSGAGCRQEAAALLGQVGTSDDLALLRSIAGRNREIRGVAVNLARRLAPSVFVDDLGAVEVRVGGQPLARNLRRKVLAMLCFLTSRPSMAATRDETLDALWPDLGPDTAANSLHQTIYFLRRVFEPDYREGYSAGYVLFDGDVVSLDRDLIDSASRRCWRLLGQARSAESANASALLDIYRGRYALDFTYEDWASDYRDTLHAAVLAAVERAIAVSLVSSDYDRVIELAHAVLALDPGADAIELALLRAYKASDRQAAAAEQYAHYSSVLRDQLGVEPPALKDV
jgi:DNA-binding SARP family transcriptional activator